MRNPLTYLKAITGAAVAGLTALSAAFLEGSDGGSQITSSEWVNVAIAFLVGLGAVYLVPNKESTEEPEA